MHFLSYFFKLKGANGKGATGKKKKQKNKRAIIAPKDTAQESDTEMVDVEETTMTTKDDPVPEEETTDKKVLSVKVICVIVSTRVPLKLKNN